MEEVCITVRPCSENGDLGEIAQSFFIVQDGAVLLTNENGNPHGTGHAFKEEATLLPDRRP